MITRNVPGLADCMEACQTTDIVKVLGLTLVELHCSVADAFLAANLVQSKGEFHRLWKSGARCEVSAERVQHPNDQLTSYPSQDGYWVLHCRKHDVRLARLVG